MDFEGSCSSTLRREAPIPYDSHSEVLLRFTQSSKVTGRFKLVV